MYYQCMYTTDEGISTLSHIKGKIAIGTTNGEVKIFTDNNLTEIYRLNDEQVFLTLCACARGLQ